MKVELYKIITKRTCWLIWLLIVIIQPLMAFISARDLVKSGFNAPEANLIQAIPPKEYLGFYDILPFGALLMIVFGIIIGTSEYQNHQLRTTLLSFSNRAKVLVNKLSSLIICSVIMALTAIYPTIAITHLTLGARGLNPISLNPLTWSLIGRAVISWISLTTLAYCIGLLAHNLIIPLVMMVPQIYLTSAKWVFLPVNAGKMLTATPTDAIKGDPLKGGLILSGWLLIFLVGAFFLFTHQDVGGMN